MSVMHAAVEGNASAARLLGCPNGIHARRAFAMSQGPPAETSVPAPAPPIMSGTVCGRVLAKDGSPIPGVSASLGTAAAMSYREPHGQQDPDGLGAPIPGRFAWLQVAYVWDGLRY